jgi:hypothetical protein
MPEQTAQQTGQPTPEPTPNQVTRLVVTWLVVTVPLAYGLFQTIKGVVPLFAG